MALELKCVIEINLMTVKVNELTVLACSGQVGAAMEGALCRMRDGYIRIDMRIRVLASC